VKKLPKKVCPICNNGYLHFVKESQKFGRVVYRQYDCDQCGPVLHNLERDVWEKEELVKVKVDNKRHFVKESGQRGGHT